VISLIVAASTNNVIGNDGELPWRLSDDLKRFKAVTMGKPIVMGRKTFESIGRPLPGRQNIVISRQGGFAADGCDVVQSIEQAVEVAGAAEEIMVIGGSEIYAAFLPITPKRKGMRFSHPSKRRSGGSQPAEIMTRMSRTTMRVLFHFFRECSLCSRVKARGCLALRKPSSL